MYRLPSQFDARPKHVPESAAGGGSTTSTCSCCVITLLTTNVLAARQLATLASKANATRAALEPLSAPETSPIPATKNISPTAWGALGFFIFPFAALVGSALSGGLSLGAPIFAVAIVIGAFCLAYDKLTNNPRRGALIAILFIAAASVGAAAEVFLWLVVVFK
jgi:hypothetical protein